MSEAKKLVEPRFKQAEVVRNSWFVTADADTTIAEIMHRDFWSHVSRNLRPFDEITVTNDKCEWMLKLHVHSAGQNWANVVELARYDNLQPKIVEAVGTGESDLYVQFRGPHARFCVMRRSDSALVKDRFQTAAEAENYIRNFEGIKVA